MNKENFEMDFSVRHANLEDLDTLLTFTLAEAKEAEGAEKSSEVVRTGILTALEDPTIARYWVLENPVHEVIGSMSVTREWSNWHAGYYWWVQSLFIHPEYRGQNLMRLLLDSVLASARKQQALEIRLYVHQDNLRAIRAYQREGLLPLPYQIMALELNRG